MSNRVAVCHTCKLKHLAADGSDEAIEFFDRHRGHVLGFEKPDAAIQYLARTRGVDLFREKRNTWREKFGINNMRFPWQKHDANLLYGIDRLGFAGYGDNANIKQVFGGEVSMDLTSLNSLASSVTAGWQSAYVDNTTNLYIDAFLYAKFATGGTAGSQKTILFYLYGASNATDFPVTGAATGGTTGASASVGGALTFLDVTANVCDLPLVYSLPTLTSSIAYVSPAFSLVGQLNQALPPFWGIGLVNASGWTFAASANAVKYDAVYYSVI